MSCLYLKSDDELAELFRERKDAYSMTFAYAQKFENRYKCEEDGWACPEESMEGGERWEAAEEDRKDFEAVMQEIVRRSSLSAHQRLAEERERRAA